MKDSADGRGLIVIAMLSIALSLVVWMSLEIGLETAKRLCIISIQ